MTCGCSCSPAGPAPRASRGRDGSRDPALQVDEHMGQATVLDGDGLLLEALLVHRRALRIGRGLDLLRGGTVPSKLTLPEIDPVPAGGRPAAGGGPARCWRPGRCVLVSEPPQAAVDGGTGPSGGEGRSSEHRVLAPSAKLASVGPDHGRSSRPSLAAPPGLVRNGRSGGGEALGAGRRATAASGSRRAAPPRRARRGRRRPLELGGRAQLAQPPARAPVEAHKRSRAQAR